jgi:hypothetical protein
VIEAFSLRFVPGNVLIYAGDTEDKWNYFDPAILGLALGLALSRGAAWSVVIPT